MLTTPAYKITQPRELLQIYPKCKKLQVLEPVIDCFEVYETYPACFNYDADNSLARFFRLEFNPTCHKDVTRIKEILKLTDNHFNFACLLFHNLIGTAYVDALGNVVDNRCEHNFFADNRKIFAYANFDYISSQLTA